MTRKEQIKKACAHWLEYGDPVAAAEFGHMSKSQFKIYAVAHCKEKIKDSRHINQRMSFKSLRNIVKAAEEKAKPQKVEDRRKS